MNRLQTTADDPASRLIAMEQNLSGAPGVVSQPSDVRERAEFEFHPAVKERLEQALQASTQRLMNCAPTDVPKIAGAQAEINLIKRIFELPNICFTEAKNKK